MNDKKYQSTGRFVVETIAGEAVLLPISDELKTLASIQRLNRTGLFIVRQMLDGHTRSQILQAITQHFRVPDPEVARKQTDDFIAAFVRQGFFTEEEV